MHAQLAGASLAIAPTPTAHFGVGSVARLGQVLAATGCASAVIVTDAGLASTPVVAAVREAAADAGIAVTMFSGVHANPTTDDLAAGADVVAGFVGSALGVAALVAVGGGSSIDAAKGISLAAVNGQRGRELDYRGEFAARGLPIVAVPTTAGTGAETNAFGVVTDPGTRRKFYVGHESTMPAAAILDPELTLGLPPRATAATGFDALTHAVESYLSIRANPWADGIALQVIKMIAGNLARACADGADLEARSQMLLAAHMAGIGMATTGLGLVHAIGHALGGRYDIAHGVTLAMVLPQVLRFSEPVRSGRLAAIAFALDVGDAGRDAAWNSAAAIDALTALRDAIGLAVRPADFGLTEQDFEAVAADALDDEVLANAPRRPAASEIEAILAQALGSGPASLWESSEACGGAGAARRREVCSLRVRESGERAAVAEEQADRDSPGSGRCRGALDRDRARLALGHRLVAQSAEHAAGSGTRLHQARPPGAARAAA